MMQGLGVGPAAAIMQGFMVNDMRWNVLRRDPRGAFGVAEIVWCITRGRRLKRWKRSTLIATAFGLGLLLRDLWLSTRELRWRRASRKPSRRSCSRTDLPRADGRRPLFPARRDSEAGQGFPGTRDTAATLPPRGGPRLRCTYKDLAVR